MNIRGVASRAYEVSSEGRVALEWVHESRSVISRLLGLEDISFSCG